MNSAARDGWFGVQCEGCGVDVVIKRGPERMCPACQAVARRDAKARAARVEAERLAARIARGAVRVCEECGGTRLNPKGNPCFSCG